ncbi:DUF4236 domain-containing protein [Pedobacter antarcticus]|uniref:DUF4236 domain-containing protein n=1 Tax=Pedobacter antarcticus TaxID=34086 RepID=UPI00191C3AD9
MAWSYRRRIKIIPGVHLNFSKSGISTSIGIKGSNITFGKKGTYINTGIPTLGIYNRQKLLDQKKTSLHRQHPVNQTTIFLAQIYKKSRAKICRV